MASHRQSTARCQIFLLLVAFGALALLVSTQTLTGQVRGGISLVPLELVYTVTFSGAVTSQPTTAKVVLWLPTTLKVDEPITLDLTAFATSYFTVEEGLSFAARIPEAITKDGFIDGLFEVYDPKIPGDPSQTIIDINFTGGDNYPYKLILRGSRSCTGFPRSVGRSCTIHLEGWCLSKFEPYLFQSFSTPCPGPYKPLRLISQVTLTARFR